MLPSAQGNHSGRNNLSSQNFPEIKINSKFHKIQKRFHAKILVNQKFLELTNSNPKFHENTPTNKIISPEVFLTLIPVQHQGTLATAQLNSQLLTLQNFQK